MAKCSLICLMKARIMWVEMFDGCSLVVKGYQGQRLDLIDFICAWRRRMQLEGRVLRLFGKYFGMWRPWSGGGVFGEFPSVSVD